MLSYSDHPTGIAGARCRARGRSLGHPTKLKYPTIFNSSDVAVVTRLDLAEAVEFDGTAANANVQRVRRGMRVIQVSAKIGQGMDEWLEFLKSAQAASP